MEGIVSKLIGIGLCKLNKSKAKRLALTLSALCALSLVIANCSATTNGTATRSLLSNKDRKAAELKARCAGWKAISYSAKGDTEQTVTEVREHNQTGLNKRCPQFKKGK